MRNFGISEPSNPFTNPVTAGSAGLAPNLEEIPVSVLGANFNSVSPDVLLALYHRHGESEPSVMLAWASGESSSCGGSISPRKVAHTALGQAGVTSGPQDSSTVTALFPRGDLSNAVADIRKFLLGFCLVWLFGISFALWLFWMLFVD